MHLPILLWIAIGAAATAIATAIPAPLAPFLAPAKGLARQWLNAPALGFLVATGIMGFVGLVLRTWIETQTGIEVPLGTVRWALMSAELGLWIPLLAWTTATVAGILTFLRGRAVAQGWHPSLVLGALTAAIWYAW